MENQRQFERFCPRNATYIIFSPGFSRRGPVINISRGGLSCIYYLDSTLPSRFIDTHINLRSGKFLLTDLEFKIVSDEKITDTPQGNGLEIRKRCIEFGKLSAKQLIQIDYYIHNFTSRLSSDYFGKLKKAFQLPF